MRNVPLLMGYYKKTGKAPEHVALGFAGYLLFMNGKGYRIQDDRIAELTAYWQKSGPEEVAQAVLGDKELWGADLTTLNGFTDAVKLNLQSLIKNGARWTLERMLLNKTTV